MTLYESVNMCTKFNSSLFYSLKGHRWHLNSKHFIKRYDDLNIKGRVLLFDMNKPDDGVKELRLEPSFKREEFRPHGISVIQNPDTGNKMVFLESMYKNHDLGVGYFGP